VWLLTAARSATSRTQLMTQVTSSLSRQSLPDAAEQQQGENRVKSMLFRMSGEGALLTICSKRRSPPGADVPGGWICRHRAQPNSSHIPPPHGHLSAAVAFGRGPLAGKHYQPPQLALDFCCC
jgi:hypothetical protein